jgi:hypothetical protein
MDLFNNPFHFLKATTRDSRHKIMELAEEQSLTKDPSQCTQARADLTNPRKRLVAEITWLPGMSPKRIDRIISRLSDDPFAALSLVLSNEKKAAYLVLKPSEKLKERINMRTISQEELKRLEDEGAVITRSGKTDEDLEEPFKSEVKKWKAWKDDRQTIGRVSIFARVNLLASGLNLLSGNLSKSDAIYLIGELAHDFDLIHADRLQEFINEDRAVSGFPEIQDISLIDEILNDRRRYLKDVIKKVLNQFSSSDLITVVTQIVEDITDGGSQHAPVLIDDLVDSYEVEASDFLDKEEQNIYSLVDKIRKSAEDGMEDIWLSPMVDDLIRIVKNWDLVAQPIQVSARSRGLDHEKSHHIANKVRNLAVFLFNDHGKLEFSQKITYMLQEVFAEVDKVAERTAQDAEDLDEIAENYHDNDEDYDDYEDDEEDVSSLVQESTPSNPALQHNQIYSPIKIMDNPSMPALWSSEDAGETWVWGNYFFTFQKAPKTMMGLAMEMQGKNPGPQTMKYYYAMLVFYHVNKNPNGPSHLPIKALGLEQVNNDMVSQLLGSEFADIAGDTAPLMLGMFSGDIRTNLGEYEGNIDKESVRKTFFNILGKSLGLSGNPKMIGNLRDAHGHPETGLPSKTKNSGCLSVLVLGVAVSSLGIYSMNFV